MSKAQVWQIIDSVRDAVSKECWIPALMAALTIPDIMGQVEFPKLVHKNGRRDVGGQYKAWFHEHVEHRYADESGFDENWKAINPYFDAAMCYQLRCSLLHQGSDEVDFEYRFEDEDDTDYSYTLELRVNSCGSYGAIWPSPQQGDRLHETIHVRVDVTTLCDALCREAERFLDKMADECFEDMGFDMVDIARWAKRHKVGNAAGFNEEILL